MERKLKKTAAAVSLVMVVAILTGLLILNGRPERFAYALNMSDLQFQEHLVRPDIPRQGYPLLPDPAPGRKLQISRSPKSPSGRTTMMTTSSRP